MFRRNSSKNKRRPLGRSKSTNSIVRNPVHALESIDPLVAQRDAHIAARLSYYRAHGRYPPDLPAMPRHTGSHGLSRSDSFMSRADTARRNDDTRQIDCSAQDSGLKRQQSVRFAGAGARPRRALATHATDNLMLPCRKPDTYTGTASSGHEKLYLAGSTEGVLGAPEEYYTVEDDLASIQSSYRKLRKSRSLFNSLSLAHSEYSFDNGVVEQPKGWNNSSSRYASINKENGREQVLERPGLRAPKSMSFLRNRREQQTSRISSRGENDLAVQLAREKFQQQMDRQKKLKSQPSQFFRSKYKRSESSMGLRKSLRNSSNTSAAMSSAFSGDTVIVQKQNGLRKTARKVSKTLKSKIKGLFGRTKSEDNDCRPNDKSVDSDGGSCLGKDEETCGHDEASISQVQSHVPSLHAVPSTQQIRSRQGSMESLNEDHAGNDDKSRVTSWTNSTTETCAASSVVGEWEGQRLSVIKENGMHMSASRIGDAQPHGPLSAIGATIDSQRVYSALMKRLEETKRVEQMRERSVEEYREFGIAPPRGSSVDRVSSQDWSPPTIRCVRKDDDVFHHELTGPESEKTMTRQYRSSPNIQGSFQSNDDDGCEPRVEKPHLNVIRSPPSKPGSPKPDLRQPRTLSQRSSAFFASPTCHLFRTASPYRRALRENMKASEETQAAQASEMQYLKSLSSFSLPLRRPSTAGSDKEVRATAAESVYSYKTDYTKGPGLHDSMSLVDSFPEPPGSQSHGDVTIFVDRAAPAPVKTPAREFSAASSVEWKTWLSSHVSKLEGTAIDGKRAQDGPSLLPLLGHVREKAEIDSPGEVFEPTAASAIVCASKPLKAIVGNSVVQPSPKQLPKSVRTPSYATDENSVPTLKTETGRSKKVLTPSISSRSSLREIHLNADENSPQSTRPSEGTPRLRAEHGIPASSPYIREEILRRRRARMGVVQGPNSSAKSSPGLNMAVERQFGKAATGSPRQSLGWRGQRSVPCLRSEASNSEDDLPGTGLAGLEIDAQAMGSRRMVEMFLSSRRSRGELRAGAGAEGSPSAFL